MRDFEKRLVSLLLVMVFVVFGIILSTTTAFASDFTIPGLDGLTISTSELTNESLIEGTLTARVTGFKDTCGSDKTQSGSVVLKNTTSTVMRLKFDYTPTPGDGGSIKIGSSTVSAAGSYNNTISGNSSLTISLKSPSGSGTASMVIKNIKFFSSDPKTVTVNGAENGLVIGQKNTEDRQFLYNGDSYTYNILAQNSSGTEDTLTLTNVPSEGYKFIAYVDVNGKILSTKDEYLTALRSDTITAVFAPEDDAVYSVDEIVYLDFDQAVSYARTSSTSKTVVLLASGKLATGNHSIPNGVTFMVPFDFQHTLITTGDNAVTASTGDRKPYRTLTMPAGSTLNVIAGGAISVPAKHLATSSTSAPCAVTGAYGHIDMEEGSTINLMGNNSALYAWGYITGQGTINAKSGSKVYELFQISDWRGGTYTEKVYDGRSTYKVFPFSQYYVQNIEAKLVVNYGASEIARASVNIPTYGEKTSIDVTYVGSGGLFELQSGATFTKYYGQSYDVDLDKTFIEVNGSVNINKIQLNISMNGFSMNIDSSSYVLPINNMDFTVKSGSTLNMTSGKSYSFLPGSGIHVEEDATVNVLANAQVYVYDVKDYGRFSGTSAHGIYSAAYSPTRDHYGTTNLSKRQYDYTKPTLASYSYQAAFDTAHTIDSAFVDINGLVHIESGGTFNTTSTGANVYSSHECGRINFDDTGSATASRTIYGYQYNADKTYNWQAVPTKSARLRNTADDVTYDESNRPVYNFRESAGSGTGVSFVNMHGRWVKDGYFHTVTFLDKDTEAVLSTQEVEEGYKPMTAPTKEPSEAEQYVLDHFEDAEGNEYADLASLPAMDADDVSYYAVFAAEPRKLHITYYNPATGLNQGYLEIDYGTKATFVKSKTGANPATVNLSAAEQYTYTGYWLYQDHTGADLKVATNSASAALYQDTVFTAEFNLEPRVYTISFFDSEQYDSEAGTYAALVPASKSVGYGIRPTLTKTKVGTDTFTVTAWQYATSTGAPKDGNVHYLDVEPIPKVTAAAYYILYYDTNEGEARYKPVFRDKTSSTTSTAGTVMTEGATYYDIVSEYEYNAAPIIPKKRDTKNYYDPVGWYYGTSKTAPGYSASADNCGAPNAIEEGQTTLPDQPVVVDGSTTYCYHIYYKKGATRYYTVAFLDEDGTPMLDSNGDPIVSAQVAYNAQPKYPGSAAPTKAADAQYTYTFYRWALTSNPSGTQYKWNASLAKLTKDDVTYTAVWTKTLRKYTVTWKNDDGTTIDSASVEYGVTPTHADPTKAATAEYTYTFAGWSDGTTTYEVGAELPAVTGAVTYTATYTRTKNKYNVTWKDEDGSTLETDEDIEYGLPVSYDGTIPSKEATAEYTYTFGGWNNGTTNYPVGTDVPTVSGHTVYTAYFTATKNAYNITWKDEDGTTLDSAPVEYGVSPTHTVPIKPATAEYTYTFAGWSDGTTTYEVGADLPAVNGAVTYTATYSATKNKYTVTWVDDEDALIEAEEYEYGQTPSHEAPDKSNAEYTYTFTGWSPAVTIVTGNITYKATYTKTPNKYTVTWMNGTTVLETDTDVAYGAAPSYGGKTPTKTGTGYTYAFAGWNDGTTDYPTGTALPTVSGNTTYTAYFTATPDKYTVYFYNRYYGSSNKLNSTTSSYTTAVTAQTQYYDDEPTLPSAPSKYTLVGKTYDYKYGHATFLGWYVTEYKDATYVIPKYDSTITGNLKFADIDPLFLYRKYLAGEYLAPGSEYKVTGTTGTKKLYCFAIYDITYNTYYYNWYYDGTGAVVNKSGVSTLKTVTPEVTQSDITSVSYTVPAQPSSSNRLNTTKNYCKKYNYSKFCGWYAVDTFYNSIGNCSANGKITKATVTPEWLYQQYLDGKYYAPSSSITISSRVWLYSIYEPSTTKTYSVTMHNAETPETEITSETEGYTEVNNTVEYGTVPTAPVKNDYLQYSYPLTGWSTKAEYDAAEDKTVAAHTADEALNPVYAAQEYYLYYGVTENKYTVTWANYDGTVLDTETEVEYGATPSYGGPDPTREPTPEYTYTFSGWDKDIAPVTGDITYTATYDYTRVTFFSRHSLTLEGDIGENFFINVTDEELAQGVKVDYEWGDGNTASYTIDPERDRMVIDGVTLYKSSCPVPAAEMTFDVTATVAIGGTVMESNVYSVRQYADVILSDSYKESYIESHSEDDYDKLETLVKSMLRYGSCSQTVFGVRLADLADHDVSIADYTPDWSTVGAARMDMNTLLNSYGLKYEGSSLIYLEKTTLRHYFTVVDSSLYSGVTSIKIGDYTVTPHTRAGYVCFDRPGVAAADLDELYVLSINDNDCGAYGALNYCNIAANHPTLTNADEKALAAATYEYNAAANAYFE